MSKCSALVVAMIGVLPAACRPAVEDRTAPQVRIATGSPGAGFHLLGQALAQFYSAELPDLDFVVDTAGPSIVAVNSLDAGAVDLAFATADLAYAAYTRGTTLNSQPHPGLRGIAVLAISHLHVIAREVGPLRSIADIKGRRIGYRDSGGREEIYPSLLSAGGDWPQSAVVGSVMPPSELARALIDGRIDALLAFGSYPSKLIQDVAGQVRIRLLEVESESARRVRARYPFLKPALIPANQYGNGQNAVRTIGVEVLMLCRADLDEEIVYRLTKTLVEGRTQLAESFWRPMSVDPDLVPATPVPLHRGAARYFRERELLK